MCLFPSVFVPLLLICAMIESALTIKPISEGCNCSHTRNDLWSSFSGRIIGGDEVLQGQYPWIVTIFVLQKTGKCFEMTPDYVF